MPEQEDFRKVFRDFIFETSKKKLIDCGDLTDLQSRSDNEADEKEWVAMIRLTGAGFKFSFRTHFDSSDAQFLFQKKLGDGGSDSYNLRLGCDYLKEYCNLTVGRLRNSMLNLNIENKLSLPLVMKRKLDASFTIRQTKIVLEDSWKFFWREGSVHCSYVIEILDDEITDQIANMKNSPDTEGQIEYL